MFIPGSQVYPHNENCAYISTKHDTLPSRYEVQELTHESCEKFKEDYVNNMPKSREEILEDKVTTLETENANITYVLMMGGSI